MGVEMVTTPEAFSPLVRKWLTRGAVPALAVAAILIGFLVVGGLVDAAYRLEYWKLALAALKTLVVGFLIAYLGVLVPRGFSEARHSFERLKEARIAFSRAKTGVDYLCLRLGVLPIVEASLLVQEIHVWKHRVELYPEELADFLEHRNEGMAPAQWANLLYEQLHAVRDVLELHAASWDTMPENRRIAELHTAQDAGIRRWEHDTGLTYSWPDAQQTVAAGAAEPRR